MLKYLEDKFGERATKGDKANLINMRNEVVRLEAMLEGQKDKTAGSTQDDNVVGDKNSEDQSEASSVSE